MNKVGIGYDNDQQAYRLGQSVATAALHAGDIDRADMLIAFCSGRVDLGRFYDGLRSVVGDGTPIIGGSSLGVITSNELSYHGYPAAVAAIKSDLLRFTVSSAGEMDQDEALAGKRMINGLQLSKADKLLLLFYDSIRMPPSLSSPPVLNSSAPLLRGVEGKLAGHVPIFGAGLIGDYDFSGTKQFCGFRVDSQQAVGCMIAGDFFVYNTIMHGCIPLDGVYRKITRMKHDIIYELDDQPVVSIINQLFGNPKWQDERPIISNLTIGVNHGNRFDKPQESQYVNRLITGVVHDGAGVGMFEADLNVGQEIQFMIRDNRMMLKSVRDNVAEIMTRIKSEGRRPFLALYINCGGRTAEYSVTEGEEAADIQKVMNNEGVPFLGFYSGVEIAPMMGRSRGLDWTGVLVILAENK
jgi:hypothetical protein